MKERIRSKGFNGPGWHDVRSEVKPVKATIPKEKRFVEKKRTDTPGPGDRIQTFYVFRFNFFISEQDSTTSRKNLFVRSGRKSPVFDGSRTNPGLIICLPIYTKRSVRSTSFCPKRFPGGVLTICSRVNREGFPKLKKIYPARNLQDRGTRLRDTATSKNLAKLRAKFFSVYLAERKF